jgi:hypothetical protein
MTTRLAVGAAAGGRTMAVPPGDCKRKAPSRGFEKRVEGERRKARGMGCGAGPGDA